MKGIWDKVIFRNGQRRYSREKNIEEDRLTNRESDWLGNYLLQAELGAT